jgi:hypothetical protein
VSLALSTDIIFPYRHLEPQDASDIAPVTPLRACAFAAIAGKDNGGSFRISQTCTESAMPFHVSNFMKSRREVLTKSPFCSALMFAQRLLFRFKGDSSERGF